MDIITHEHEEIKHQSHPKIIFRNYTPMDPSLDTSISTNIQPNDDLEDMNRIRKNQQIKNNNYDYIIEGEELSRQEHSKSRNKLALEKALQQAQITELLSTSKYSSSDNKRKMNHNNAANHSTQLLMEHGPKKINWDLKRDIEKKIQKLERRTQQAIIDLLRERLERNAQNNDDDYDGNASQYEVVSHNTTMLQNNKQNNLD